MNIIFPINNYNAKVTLEKTIVGDQGPAKIIAAVWTELLLNPE